MTESSNQQQIIDALHKLDLAESHGRELLSDELLILASALESGYGDTAPDPVRAGLLTDRAADMGHPLALVMKGAAIIREAGGAETPEALDYIRKAAEAGEAESLFNIGIELYVNAPSPDSPDAVKGIDMIRRSADRDYGPALFQLAAMHMLGRGLETDVESARYYELAALDCGDPKAGASINHFFADGECLNDKSEIDRDKVIDRAIDAGCAAAMYAGFCRLVEKGVDTEDEHNKAIKLLRSAADNGYAPATIALADFGRLTDESTASMLEKPAADHFPVAMSTLGRMLFGGEGVEPDRERGLTLIENALNFGDPDAMAFFAEMTRNGTLPDPTDGAREVIYSTLCIERFADEATKAKTDIKP